MIKKPHPPTPYATARSTQPTMGPLCAFMLIANAGWDLLSALTIWLRETSPRCAAVASLHTAMWKEEADRTNPAAGVLFAFLLLHWAYFRAMAVLVEWNEAAIWTYLMESALFASQAVAGTMHLRLAAGATALCAGAIVLLLQDM